MKDMTGNIISTISYFLLSIPIYMQIFLLKNTSQNNIISYESTIFSLLTYIFQLFYFILSLTFKQSSFFSIPFSIVNPFFILQIVILLIYLIYKYNFTKVLSSISYISRVIILSIVTYSLMFILVYSIQTESNSIFIVSGDSFEYNCISNLFIISILTFLLRIFYQINYVFKIHIYNKDHSPISLIYIYNYSTVYMISSWGIESLGYGGLIIYYKYTYCIFICKALFLFIFIISIIHLLLISLIYTNSYIELGIETNSIQKKIYHSKTKSESDKDIIEIIDIFNEN